MQESFIKAFLVATETPGLSVLTPNTGVPVTVLPRGAALVKGPCEKMNLGALVRVFGPQTSRPSWLLACCLSVCWLFPALGLGMAQKPEVSYPAKRVLGTEHGVVGEVCAFGTLASGGEGALGSLEPPPGSWRPAQLCLLFQPGGGGGGGSGTSLLSTLQMFPAPQSRHHPKSEPSGAASPGSTLPWALSRWLGFMAGSAGETRVFAFSLSKNTETVICSTSGANRRQARAGRMGRRASRPQEAAQALG